MTFKIFNNENYTQTKIAKGPAEELQLFLSSINGQVSGKRRVVEICLV